MNVRQIIPIDKDWKFKKGMDIAGFDSRIDDSSWEEVTIPHDWSIFGPFLETNPSGPRGGYAPGGIAWYRRALEIPNSYEGKRVYIELDGVYMNSEVYINGERVAKYPYGYTTLYYDITKFVTVGGDNLLSVKVDTATQPGSRWYSGSGIYRHVRLIVTNNVLIGQWGTFVTTPQVSDEQAQIDVETTVVNESIEDVEATVKIELVDANGKVVANSSQPISVKGVSRDMVQSAQDIEHFGPKREDIGVEAVLSQSMVIDNPRLWSLENPYLYTVRTEVLVDGLVSDDDEVSMGIRTIEFTPDKGFFLNGVYTKIKGVCLHHDGGAMGAACPDRTKERQIQILKEMGCNAIRTSHNPPSPVLLDLCDRYGMMVMDEVFDEYRGGKRPRVFDEVGSLKRQVRRPIHAYAQFFDDYHEVDLTTMVKRDRNHPSIILWSIGNEISEHMREEGIELTTRLHNIVKKHDVTRPTVTGIVHLGGANPLGIPDLVDVSGYNYKELLYEEEHAKYPERIIIGSETSSAAPFEMRAVYDNFLNAAPDYTKFSDVTQKPGDIATIKSDERYIRAEQSMSITNSLEYISGLFIWTGFDYIGEPSPYAWPSKTSYFGVIDTCGFPKDAYYMYQSQWTNEPMLHVFPHWNWEGKEGQDIPVWCYTNCDSVELFLNGESLGEKQGDANELLHLDWHIPYTKGILKAVAKRDGEIVIEKVHETTGEPSGIKLVADRNEINADGQDVSYVTVEIVDEQGRLVPDATNLVKFEVEGSGKLAGVDNGDSTSLEAYKGSARSALGGICLAIVQSTCEAGNIYVRAESEGLEGCLISISTK